MYADYEYYRDVYQGSALDESAFPGFIRRASLFIDQLTFDRLHYGRAVTDVVKMAACAVAEAEKAYESLQNAAIAAAGIKSENNDGYSVSYQDSAAIKESLRTAMSDAAYPYLISTGLMDRAIGGCCR